MKNKKTTWTGTSNKLKKQGKKVKLTLSDIDKAIKKELQKEGVNEKWVGKHLIIDVIGFDNE